MPKTIDQLIINSPYEEPKEHWKYNLNTQTFTREPGRRTSYEVNPKTGLLGPEYVNIFGIPFSFLPHEGDGAADRYPLHPKQWFPYWMKNVNMKLFGPT